MQANGVSTNLATGTPYVDPGLLNFGKSLPLPRLGRLAEIAGGQRKTLPARHVGPERVGRRGRRLRGPFEHGTQFERLTGEHTIFVWMPGRGIDRRHVS